MFKSITSLALGMGLLAVTAQAQCTRNATVVADDTCWGISNEMAVSTYQLAINNPSINDNCTNLEIGQDLCLGQEGADCTQIYVVLEGDTCDGITSKYGLGDGVLLANNPNLDSACDSLFYGEVVCVATTTYDYTTDSSSSTVSVPTALATATATSTAATSTSTASTNDEDDDDDDDEDYCYDDDEDCEEEDDDSDLPYCDETS